MVNDPLTALGRKEGEVMVDCPNGHGNPEHYQFCGECGAPLPAICVNGHHNAEHYQFCGECGVPLVAANPAQLRRTGQHSEPTQQRTAGSQSAHDIEGPGPTPLATSDEVTIAAANTLAAPTPGLNDAPTQYVPTKPAPVHGVTPTTQVSEGPVRRPVAVTAAVVIAGLWAAVLALFGTLGLIEGFNSLGYHVDWQYSTIMLVLGVGSLILAAVLVWGAIAAFRGVTSKGILFAPAIVAVFLAIAMAVGFAIGNEAWAPTVGLGYPLILLLPSSLLVMRRSSKDFFCARSRGKPTA
jgi:hypothetical protein